MIILKILTSTHYKTVEVLIADFKVVGYTSFLKKYLNRPHCSVCMTLAWAHDFPQFL